MNWDAATAVLDLLIFLLLAAWMVMDRCNWYFRKPPEEKEDDRT